jgi:single-stranded DNA-binding protein
MPLRYFFLFIILLGNLGDKPIIKYTADSKAIATLSVATSKAWVDKQIFFIVFFIFIPCI